MELHTHGTAISDGIYAIYKQNKVHYLNKRCAWLKISVHCEKHLSQYRKVTTE